MSHGDASARSSARPSTRPSASVEPLEHRRLMSATLERGVLTVEGDDGPNTIYLFQTRDPQTGRPATVGVQFAPDSSPSDLPPTVAPQTFPAGAVRRVVVRCGGGDDTVSLAYVGTTAPEERVAVSCRTVIEGGDGNDRLVGGAGRDLIDGGAGDDYHAGLAGNDTVLAGDGDDIVLVSEGRDVVFGGAGNDFINAAGGSTPLGLIADGGAGNDRINGAGGNADRLSGGAGDDQLSGNGGRDRVFGGDGDDLLEGDADPRTVLVGGAGRDTFGVTEAARPRIRDFDPDEDQLSFPIMVDDPVIGRGPLAG